MVYALAAVTGIGYAGAQLFPLAMLPDTAAHDARVTGENRVGVFTGVWTAVETLGLAIGPAVFAVVLALGGYRSSTGDRAGRPAGVGPDGDRRRVLGRPGGAGACSACSPCAATG